MVSLAFLLISPQDDDVGTGARARRVEDVPTAVLADLDNATRNEASGQLLASLLPQGRMVSRRDNGSLVRHWNVAKGD